MAPPPPAQPKTAQRLVDGSLLFFIALAALSAAAVLWLKGPDRLAVAVGSGLWLLVTIAPLIALVTGWSVYAFHRVISYEGPIMGWRFVTLRMLVSWFVPPAAALGAGLIAAAAGLSIAIP
jgi:hypothetical protein